jgi:hypothetical protein
MDENKISYRTPWVGNSKNEEFWKEVLEGRTIKQVGFDAEGVSHMLLDDGQTIYFTANKGRFYIKD